MTKYKFVPVMKAANLTLGIRFLLRQVHGQTAHGEIEA